MADLSAYVDFSVLLDKSLTTPVIVLTDTSNYPVGVAATVTGVFSVRQPDGIRISGNFTNPDVRYVSGMLTPAQKELRLAFGGNFQNGIYSITYTVKATGYDDTVKTKTFTLSYSQPELVITDLTDVFTPDLSVKDDTDYDKDFYTLSSQTRSWAYELRYEGINLRTGSGTNQIFSLAYSSQYYDANYKIDFTTVFTYTSTLTNYLSLKDKITYTTYIDVYTPATLTTLITAITAMKAAIANHTYCGSSSGCASDYTPFIKAKNLLIEFVQKGHDGDLIGLSSYIDHIQKILICSGALNKVHTNEIIPAYDFDTAIPYNDWNIPDTVDCGCCDDNNNVVDNDKYTIPYLTEGEIQFQVGVTRDADDNIIMNEGDTQVTLQVKNIEKGSARVFLDGAKVYLNRDDRFSITSIAYTNDSVTIAFNEAVYGSYLFSVEYLYYALNRPTNIVDFDKFYEAVTVDTYADALLAAIGTQKKIIKVLVDETRGNIEDQYFYEGDNNGLGYKLIPYLEL